MKPHKEYISAKRAFLIGKRCAVYPLYAASEVHHKRGRLGPLLVDKRYWLAVSAQGHRWIHEHPEEARRRGWLAKPGQWNRTPRTKNRLPSQPASGKV